MCHARSCVGQHSSPTHANICKVRTQINSQLLLISINLIIDSLYVIWTSPISIGESFRFLLLSSCYLFFSPFFVWLSFLTSFFLSFFVRARSTWCCIFEIATGQMCMAEIANFPGERVLFFINVPPFLLPFLSVHYFIFCTPLHFYFDLLPFIFLHHWSKSISSSTMLNCITRY